MLCGLQSSHGTHEFYTERGHITKQLLLRGGFNAVVLESDFPDAFQVRDYAEAGFQLYIRSRRTR